jgi:hypothetical protein
MTAPGAVAERPSCFQPAEDGTPTQDGRIGLTVVEVTTDGMPRMGECWAPYSCKKHGCPGWCK